MNSIALPFRLKLAFGVGQSATGAMNISLALFLLFYYNQVLGLSGTLAGLAVGVSVLLDGVSDPLIGSFSDHWRSRLGRRHPFMYASILPLGVSFDLLFYPLVDSEIGLFLWLMVFANVARTSMTLFNIPHMALGAEITEDFGQRSALVAYRVFFVYGGMVGCIVLGFGLFFVPTPEFENGQLNAAAYPGFGLLLSVLMGSAILWTAWGTRSAIRSSPGNPEGPRVTVAGALVRVFRDLVDSLRNVSFRWLFGGMLNVYAVGGVNAALALFCGSRAKGTK